MCPVRLGLDCFSSYGLRRLNGNQKQVKRFISHYDMLLVDEDEYNEVSRLIGPWARKTGRPLLLLEPHEEPQVVVRALREAILLIHGRIGPFGQARQCQVMDHWFREAMLSDEIVHPRGREDSLWRWLGL